MTKIALIAAAVLVATGTAFAGSDHYGSDGANQPAASANVDNMFTASTGKPVTAQPDGATAKVMPEYGQGIWGR